MVMSLMIVVTMRKRRKMMMKYMRKMRTYVLMEIMLQTLITSNASTSKDTTTSDASTSKDTTTATVIAQPYKLLLCTTRDVFSY